MTRSKSTLAGLPIPANLSFVGDNLYSSASSSSLPSIASLPNITSNLSGSVSHDPHTSIQDSAVTANTAKSIATRSQTDSLSRKAAIKLTSHGNKKKSNSTRQRHKNKLKAEKAGTSHQLHQVDSASKGHETVRKLLEISKHTLKKEDVCSMTDFASSAGKPQLSLQENSSSIDSLHITTSTALTTGSIINLPHDTRINFSANAALSAVITSTNVVSSDVSLPLTCLPHEHNLRDGEADVSSIAQVTTSHSIRLSPHFQDGLLPMLSIGPGLNIPLLIRPAGTQLVSGKYNLCKIFNYRIYKTLLKYLLISNSIQSNLINLKSSGVEVLFRIVSSLNYREIDIKIYTVKTCLKRPLKRIPKNRFLRWIYIIA